MAEPIRQRASYDDLFNIPENMTGEIINGEMTLTPRPSRKHIFTVSALDKKIGPPYQFGDGGGPGGWIILVEPEVKLGEDILVPDLGGWKVERYPIEEPHNWISVVPDWACEVASPGTLRIDKMEKMTIYAQHLVPWFWLVNPGEKTLDVFRLEKGEWVVAGFFVGEAKVRAQPFIEIEFNLSDFWQETWLGRVTAASEE